jgi:hypothetical protein
VRRLRTAPGSDALGIFAVLALAGLTQLLTTEPGSLRATVAPAVATGWSVSLLVFGGIGVLSMLLPRRRILLALVLELGARVSLGFGAATYAAALIDALGSAATFPAVVFGGISLMFFSGARQIRTELHHRRREMADLIDLIREHQP